jgi:hypothetical protein
LRAFGDKLARRILKPKTEEVRKDWRTILEEFHQIPLE